MDSNNKKGFTLVEILIVVAIIGLLASIVLVGMAGFRQRGRDTRRIADLRQTQHALELYFNKCGYYPGGAASGVCNTNNPTSWDELRKTLADAQIGISVMANDPLPGVNYGYSVSSNRQSYILGATLENADNQALNQDYDDPLTGSGTSGFTTCSDPAYCLSF